jgi:thiol-disulfide isomerase/thioredoxin
MMNLRHLRLSSFLLDLLIVRSSALFVAPPPTLRRQRCHAPGIRFGCPERQGFTLLMRMTQSQQEVEKAVQTNDAATEINLATLRVAEIRRRLDEMSIDYSDCFDKESLLARLRDAINGSVSPTVIPTSHNDAHQAKETTPAVPSPTTAAQTNESNTPSTVDKNAIRSQVETLSVRALREELASRQIRWAGMLEKRDLVQAVVQARVAAQTFSVTGTLVPGTVTDVTDDVLRQEITAACTTASLLVDVYAVWCGPCQLMAKQLLEASQVWGDSVRVVKMDSDKYPSMASTLRAQALPTLILYSGAAKSTTASSSSTTTNDAGFREIGRIEGALSKDQLLQWVQSKVNA